MAYTNTNVHLFCERVFSLVKTFSRLLCFQSLHFALYNVVSHHRHISTILVCLLNLLPWDSTVLLIQQYLYNGRLAVPTTQSGLTNRQTAGAEQLWCSVTTTVFIYCFGVNSSETPSGICYKSITTKCTQSPRGTNKIRENSTKQGCVFDQINAKFDTLPIKLSYLF